MPTTMALSPANTRSTMMTWRRALSSASKGHTYSCIILYSLSVRSAARLHEAGLADGVRHDGRALPDQLAGDDEDDPQSDVAEHMEPLQQAGDEGGRGAHEANGQDEAEDQNPRMIVGGGGHGQDVVQRHRNVGDHDLRQGLPQRLHLPLAIRPWCV